MCSFPLGKLHIALIVSIQEFLTKNLQLELHPKKLIIRKLSQGIDFVGYVLFERYTLLRTRTKQRMKKRLKGAYECYLKGKMDAISMDRRLQSYLGILSHANQHTLSQALKNAYWVRNKNFETELCSVSKNDKKTMARSNCQITKYQWP